MLLIELFLITISDIVLKLFEKPQKGDFRWFLPERGIQYFQKSPFCPMGASVKLSGRSKDLPQSVPRRTFRFLNLRKLVRTSCQNLVVYLDLSTPCMSLLTRLSLHTSKAFFGFSL